MCALVRLSTNENLYSQPRLWNASAAAIAPAESGDHDPEHITSALVDAAAGRGFRRSQRGLAVRARGTKRQHRLQLG